MGAGVSNLEDKANTARQKGDRFDIVIVPHGSMDSKVVVGTIDDSDRPTLEVRRVRSVRRLWQSKLGAQVRLNLERVGYVRGLEAGVSLSTNANDFHVEKKDQSKVLLEQLAASLENLAANRAAFRADLLAAIAEGEELLNAAIG